MIVRTGDLAKELYKEARKHDDALQPDPKVYDYRIEHGAVLIRRGTHECLYIKTTGHKAGRAIALQGAPEEFATYRHSLEKAYTEMEIVNWREVEEMVAWAPKVPRL